MPDELRRIIRSPQPEIEETFAAHQTTHQFYHEVRARSDFKRHCEWYSITAERNRQDLEKMRGELNIFSLFRRR